MVNLLKTLNFSDMDKLVAAVIKSWPQEIATATPLTVALSGGVDSVVLLHILANITTQYKYAKLHLDAIHINHGISPNAQDWVNFCQEICQQLSIPLTVATHQVHKNGGESLENNARIVRYKEFFSHPTNIIALAHHKIDQVETTLAQIFRGSDLHNIAAMRPITIKQRKIFWRPLLNFSKHDLEEYAQRNNLTHISDESNTNNQYLRNFIRNKIIPELVSWDNHIESKILKVNTQVQSVIALCDEIAVHDLNNCQSLNNGIDINKFKCLSPRRQNNSLSHFIIQQNKPLPSNRQITEFIRQLNTCATDKSPRLQLDHLTAIVMHKQTIFIQNFH